MVNVLTIEAERPKILSFESRLNWEGVMRDQRIEVKRSNPSGARTASGAPRGSLLNTLLTYLPGAWIDPKNNELITLYRLRYRMAMEEEKYDTAMIFLNKILELDPMNLEAKLCKGEIYHRCLADYTRAIEQYNKVIRLSAGANEVINTRARAAMSEIMELLS
jgi:tetratricopeptide (TPR) repeat protein